MNRQLEVTFKNGEVYCYPADERGWASGVRGGRRFLLVGYAMIPEDVVERWRLVEPAPITDERCPSVMDRNGVPGDEIRCFYEAGHDRGLGHAARDRAGNELRWTDPPNPAEVEEIVQWAERQARRFECPARAWLKGTSYSCETPASYPHTEHGNAAAGLMWSEVTS